MGKRTATHSTTQKKRGRPRLPPDEGKRAPFATRLRQELRDRLEGAASSAGRSLSEEIEYRLERSIADEDQAGGRHVYVLGELVKQAAHVTEISTGKRFTDDARTRALLAETFSRLLKALYADTKSPPDLTDVLATAELNAAMLRDGELAQLATGALTLLTGRDTAERKFGKGVSGALKSAPPPPSPYEIFMHFVRLRAAADHTAARPTLLGGPPSRQTEDTKEG